MVDQLTNQLIINNFDDLAHPVKKVTNQQELPKTIKERNKLRDSMQGWCQICRTTDKLALDHDHRTNLVRGVLCKTCNSGLGMFKDSPRLLNRAIQYLKHNGAVEDPFWIDAP